MFILLWYVPGRVGPSYTIHCAWIPKYSVQYRPHDGNVSVLHYASAALAHMYIILVPYCTIAYIIIIIIMMI